MAAYGTSNHALTRWSERLALVRAVSACGCVLHYVAIVMCRVWGDRHHHDNLSLSYNEVLLRMQKSKRIQSSALGFSKAAFLQWEAGGRPEFILFRSSRAFIVALPQSKRHDRRLLRRVAAYMYTSCFKLYNETSRPTG